MDKNVPSILKQIVETELKSIDIRKISYPVNKIEKEISDSSKKTLNLAGALWGESVRIIAEIKQSSPTKGTFTDNFSVEKLANTYAKNGAAAVSVLTNTYFNGHLSDLVAAQNILTPYKIPVLRKEFIVDEYQIYESRAAGADAILLIISILDTKKLKTLMSLAKDLSMQTLVEIHNEDELKIALDVNAEIIGINNRNLHTFETNIKTTEELAQMIPNHKITVSESGINSKSDIERVQKVNVNAVLVGEALVSSKNPAEKLKELI
ncbi:MAG: indole-3-glycerol phosphate synthase TrpC [Dehalococcoidia bacterium]